MLNINNRAMTELEEIEKLTQLLAKKKSDYVLNQFKKIKKDYSHLIGKCYKSDYDVEYFIIEDIDYEVKFGTTVDILLIGMCIVNDADIPRVESFKKEYYNFFVSNEAISFEQFEEHLKNTLQNINNVVADLRK